MKGKKPRKRNTTMEATHPRSRRKGNRKTKEGLYSPGKTGGITKGRSRRPFVSKLGASGKKKREERVPTRKGG